MQNKDIMKDKKLEYIGKQEEYQRSKNSQNGIGGEDQKGLHISLICLIVLLLFSIYILV